MASNALQYKHPKATNDCSTQHVNQKPEDKFILSSLPAPTPLNFHSSFTHWARFFSVSLPTFSFCPHFPPLFQFVQHLESLSRSCGCSCGTSSLVSFYKKWTLLSGQHSCRIHALQMMEVVMWTENIWKETVGGALCYYTLSVGRCSVTIVNKPFAWKLGFDHFSSLHWQKDKENVLNTQPVRVWQQM